LYNGEDGARSYTEAIKNIADVIEPTREKWDGSATGLSEGSGDVTVSYKGSLIGSLRDTGSAVLKTKDVNCEDDIEVVYRPSPSEYTIVYGTKLHDFSISGNNKATAGEIVSVSIINSGETSQIYLGIEAMGEEIMLTKPITSTVSQTPVGIRFVMPAADTQVNLLAV
jgi:hypothetical protein